MTQMIFSLMWLFLYCYYVEQSTSVSQGKGKKLITLLIGLFILCTFFLLIGLNLLPSFFLFLGWLMESLLFTAYVLFFNEEISRITWWRILLPGIVLSLLSFGDPSFLFTVNGGVLLMFFLLLSNKRCCLTWKNGLLTGLTLCMLSAFSLFLTATFWVQVEPGIFPILLWGTVLLQYLLFFSQRALFFPIRKALKCRPSSFRGMCSVTSMRKSRKSI